jgi:hypothetical protein
MSDQDVPSGEAPTETSYEELFPGTTPSTQHRMYFKRFGRLEPVKGEFVQERPPLPADNQQVFARLFTYVIEGPPYTQTPTIPTGVATDDPEKLVDETLVNPPRLPTRFKVTQINAIHAREDVIASSAFKQSGYGPGFQVVWSEVEEGAPEYEFAQALASAFADYDALVGSCETYGEWKERHQAWLHGVQPPGREILAGEHAVGGKWVPPLIKPEQRKALAKLYSPSNVEMKLRFRASRHENWAKIAPKPEELEPPAAPATEEQAKVFASLTEKLREFSETCSPEEQEILKGLGTLAINPGAAGPNPYVSSFMGKLTRAFGGPPPQQPGDMARPGFALPPVGGDPNFPFQGEEWIELSPSQVAALGVTPEQAFGPGVPAGAFGPGGPGLSEQLSGFAQDFAGPGVEGPVTMQDLLQGESQARGYGPPPLWAYPGLPPGHAPPPGPFSGPYPGYPGAFAPGANESFTMGDGVEGQGQRQLEAATAEADALRARLHADANENKRKVGLFKDVVAGGLRFLLEKLEGPAAPVGAEPVGPIEQAWGRAGVNGGRAGVMAALQEQLGAFGARPQAQAMTPPVAPVGPYGLGGVGAPGEEF